MYAGNPIKYKWGRGLCMLLLLCHPVFAAYIFLFLCFPALPLTCPSCMQTRRHEPHPFLFSCASAPPLIRMRTKRSKTSSVKKMAIPTRFIQLREVTKILLVKNHAWKEKESFMQKPNSTCATFVVTEEESGEQKIRFSQFL